MELATLTASTASTETLCISCQYVAGARSWVPYIEEPGNISSNKGSSAEAQRPRELKYIEAIPCDFRFTSPENPQVLTQAWALKLPNVPTWLSLCPILISLAHHRMVQRDRNALPCCHPSKWLHVDGTQRRRTATRRLFYPWKAAGRLGNGWEWIKYKL